MFEILEMTPQLEAVISAEINELKILNESKKQGMITLRQDGVIKALKGFISIEEVLKETMEI